MVPILIFFQFYPGLAPVGITPAPQPLPVYTLIGEQTSPTLQGQQTTPITLVGNV